jgi:hypothetical protein
LKKNNKKRTITKKSDELSELKAENAKLRKSLDATRAMLQKVMDAWKEVDLRGAERCFDFGQKVKTVLSTE